MSFNLYVICRRGGVTRDGGLHESWPTRPTEEQVEESVNWLRGFYDDVRYKLKEDRDIESELGAWRDAV